MGSVLVRLILELVNDEASLTCFTLCQNSTAHIRQIKSAKKELVGKNCGWVLVVLLMFLKVFFKFLKFSFFT